MGVGDHLYGVILAGGIGTRFWPKSREDKPKQYLAMISDETLIQNTVARLLGLVPSDRLFVVSTKAQEPLLKEQLPHLQADHFIFEPVGRNTAPAIGLAAVHLRRLDPNAVMLAAPADHLIQRTELFYQAVRAALRVIEKEPSATVTFGIPPTYPATGYGYIEAGRMFEEPSVFQAASFREKPDQATAELFLQSGTFYWNSGIFLWRVDRLMQLIEKWMPELYEGLREIDRSIDEGRYDNVCAAVYHRLVGCSIDYGVMEKADCIYMVKGEFLWNDLGSWEEVYRLSPKDDSSNAVFGKPLLKDVRNSYIDVQSRTVSIIGVEDLIVIEQADALLICGMRHSQEVRWVTNELHQQKNRNSLKE
ncbi:MAG: mannose-1-phosphate guanylyltransferase [candidate division KSB1 bacterium]|nr:mannose-1-phosphate guanylyltransferase [candidate division KSB1 bacterium]MDZ7345953.1 mannose-1-phosphate guanylyltransferase [candidate division KSB1 bacterium]